jgi:hypothetical protein
LPVGAAAFVWLLFGSILDHQIREEPTQKLYLPGIFSLGRRWTVMVGARFRTRD